jgi:hypothetical protein
MSKPMLFDTRTARAPGSLSRQGRGSNSKSRSKLAQGVAVFLVIAALGGGSAYAATSSRSADPGTPTLLADVPSGGTPVTLTGKVTRVSIRRHYLVIDSAGTPIIVTRRTSFRLIRRGLAGVLVGRTVHVRAIKLNGKLYAVALERLLGHLPRTP